MEKNHVSTFFIQHTFVHRDWYLIRTDYVHYSSTRFRISFSFSVFTPNTK